jgi:DNA-binding SARP family transcriptional activator
LNGYKRKTAALALPPFCVLGGVTMLHVFAFGKLRLQCGDKLVDSFPTRHVEELLGYLLLHPQTLHPREKLIDLLWPHSGSDNDRGRFSTVLWRLRGLFEQLDTPADSYLRVTRDWISFAPQEPYDLDIQQFEGLLHKAQGEAGELGQEQCWVDAAAVYQGDLYDGIYADWCLVERERLARLYLRTLGQLMASLMQRGGYQEAIGLGREILRRDPLREEVHRALMRCYWLSGRRSEAVRQFQVCSTLLMEELQVTPMGATIGLYNQIVMERVIGHEGRGGSAELMFGPSQNGYQELSPVQAAFVEFQEAAERLNRLLDEAN